jgi:integrase
VASIRLHNGKWQARVIRKGHPAQTKSFSKKQDAERWGRAIEADLERGLSAPRATGPAMTLGQLLGRYRLEVVPAFKGATEDAIRLKAIERDRVCRTTLTALSAAQVAAYRDRRLGSISAGTVIRELAYLSAAINHARREWGLNLENPVALVRKPPTPRGRERLLRDDERQSLRLALQPTGRRSRWMPPLVELALATGMRRGELLRLRWKDVDLERRVAFLADTKNGESRRVPLSTAAIEVLQGLERRDGERVFPVTGYAVAAAFKHATARAGLADFRFHDLRHTAITAMSGKLPNVIELAAVTGHKSLKMLQRYYHPRAEELAVKLG